MIERFRLRVAYMYDKPKVFGRNDGFWEENWVSQCVTGFLWIVCVGGLRAVE